MLRIPSLNQQLSIFAWMKLILNCIIVKCTSLHNFHSSKCLSMQIIDPSCNVTICDVKIRLWWFVTRSRLPHSFFFLSIHFSNYFAFDVSEACKVSTEIGNVVKLYFSTSLPSFVSFGYWYWYLFWKIVLPIVWGWRFCFRNDSRLIHTTTHQILTEENVSQVSQLDSFFALGPSFSNTFSSCDVYSSRSWIINSREHY